MEDQPSTKVPELEVPDVVESTDLEPVSFVTQTSAPSKPEISLPDLPVTIAAVAAQEVAHNSLSENHEATAPEAVSSVPVPAPVKEKPSAANVAAPIHDSALQILFMTEEELDAKTIVKLVCQLPSVTGCAVMFEDGLRLAGNFPDGDTQGFSAMAAPFFKRASRFVSELELGSLQTFTLHTENGLLSFFMHDNICVGVRHTGRGFMPSVREKLEVVTRELARMYATAKLQPDSE